MIKFSDGTKLTFYQWMGIKPQATTDEIKKAYKNLARKIHPDTQPKERHDEAHQAFCLLQQGYDLLMDQNKRNQYDVLIGVKRPQPQPMRTVIINTWTPDATGTGTTFTGSWNW